MRDDVQRRVLQRVVRVQHWEANWEWDLSLGAITCSLGPPRGPLSSGVPYCHSCT
jgi:hypothetical protein